jgi:hypothetical protein
VSINQRRGVDFGNERRYAGSGIGTTVVGHRRAARVIRFHLVNFHNYIGEAVRIGSVEQQGFCMARLTLKAHGWRIGIDQLPDWKDRLDNVRAGGGYALSHVGALRRPSYRPIAYTEATSILESLHFFFGFLRGFWCGPVIPIGDGQTKVLWTEWSNWILTPWTNASSWFPEFQAKQTSSLYSSFRALWRRSLWNRVLRHTVHWYVLANSNRSSTVAKIVSSFLGLETLAWAVIVEDRQVRSNGKFNELGAERKIELLLDELGIPKQIPKRFKRLSKVAKSRGSWSGPKFLATVRNAIVHPKKSKRQFLARLHHLVIWELSELGLAYLELIHLALLGYKGVYTLRVFPGWAGDGVETVPWA